MPFFSLAQNHLSPEREENDSYSTPAGLSLGAQDDIPRLIAEENGHILFANDAFLDLCDAIAPMDGANIDTIFKAGAQIISLQDGLHHLTLKQNNAALSLQLNWIENPSISSTRILVISAEAALEETEEKTAAEKLLHYVQSKIAEKNKGAGVVDILLSNKTPFIDLSFDACSITHHDGSFESINENFSDIFGYDLHTLANKTIIDITHPNSRAEIRNILQSLRQDSLQGPITLETYALHASGQVMWIEWKHKAVGDKIYSTGRDLTPLKSYRAELDKQQKKLSEAEAIGHIGQWHWPVGAEAIEFSDQLFKIFGLEKNNFQPTLDTITAMIHRQDAGRMEQVFQRAVIEQNNYDMDFRITRPDGQVRFIRCEGRCETDAEDDVIALYGIMQDVTDTTKRELDLRAAKESVERAYAAKTQFLANMSHELRTPLNAIIGFSEMIERQLLGPIGTEKYLEYIAGIRQSGEHLLDLISDILDMSKIEAGKYELSLEKFNIAKVIRMAVHMMEGRAIDSEIKIKIDITNEDLQMVADRRAVMQMILNLLSNSVKFSKHGGLVDIRLMERENFVSIHVEDQGIGIPANKLANITEPFEQAQSHYTREYEGSGLGLAITKELAEIHGGDLMIESELGVGTLVKIRLPYTAQKIEKRKN